jgi:flagellar hook protein FlgE
MSLLGAINTAVSGLTAQSAAFTNISDNIANSQTVGYKGVNTSFSDYLTSSTATQNLSGAVGTTPQYQNSVAGTVTQSSDPLALAISGQGFFNVSETTGAGNNSFSTTQYYTRTGDFSLNDSGYLVNGSGEYLDGYNVDPTTGQINTGNLQPIKIDTNPLSAVQTAAVSYSAELPNTTAASASTTSPSSEVQVIDKAGASHKITLSWTQSTTNPNSWTVQASSPDNNSAANTPPTLIGSATVVFGANGDMTSITGDGTGLTGSVAATGANPNPLAAVTMNTNFNGSSQPINLDFGAIGTSNGVTYASGSSTYNLQTLTADGQKVGDYTGISMTAGGDVVASYDNSQTQVIAHIPLATFNAPDALQRQNGQAFTATAGSGLAQLSNANQNGTGQLVTGSVESSNVDIATELTKLIAAQEAYGANAKMVTTGDQMTQTTLQLKQ